MRTGVNGISELELENDTLASIEDNYADDALQTWQMGLQVGSLLVICILSVGGNFLVFFSLLKKEQLRFPSNRLVFSLTFSNFVLSLLVFPFIVVSCVYGVWIFGIFWCNFTAFLTVLVTSASALNIAVIAIDRYYAIVKPLLYTITITNSRSTLLLLTVWLLAFACALPPFFGWSKFHYLSIEGVCFVDWGEHVGYTAFVLTTSLLLPFLTMIICYYFIFQVVRTKCRKIHVGSMSGNETLGSLEPPRLVSRQSSAWRFPLPRKPSWLISAYSSPVKGLRTICFVLGMFITTTFPFLVVSTAKAGLVSDWFPWWFHVVSLWLLFMSSATYPVVYGLFNRSIRKHIKHCLPPFSFSKLCRSSVGDRRSSFRLSASLSLLDFSSFKHFRSNISRRSSTVSFDGNRIIFNCNSRKGSQDSGAVMTESDGEVESNYFVSSRNHRRLSAPSRLQVVSSISNQPNCDSVPNKLQVPQTLNFNTKSARGSLILAAARRSIFCRQLNRAAQIQKKNSISVINVPDDVTNAASSSISIVLPTTDFDVSVDEGIDNELNVAETNLVTN